MEDQAGKEGKTGEYDAALADYLAQLRVSPRAHWDAIAICTGRLWITRFHTGTRYILFTKDCPITVRWRFDDPPPGLTQGTRITLYGRIATANQGGHFTIEHALTVRVKQSVVRRMLTHLFDKIGMAPVHYDDFKDKLLPSGKLSREKGRDLPEWMTDEDD